MRLLDLAGQSFGRLTVIARTQNAAGGRHVAWICKCACGSMTTATTVHLRRGHTTSCGCAKREISSITHGHSVGHAEGEPVSPEYAAWSAMKQRCLNPDAVGYADYGGRGITVVTRWRDDFATFLADMGPRPAGTTIDRVNNDGNYEPGNCRWATPFQQANNKRSNLFVEYRGEMMTLKQLARFVGVPYLRLYKLYRKHRLPIEECVQRAKVAGRQVKRHSPPAAVSG